MSLEAIISYLRMNSARSRQGMEERFDSLSPEEYSHLYLAIGRTVLAAVICIEDPLREDRSGRGRKAAEGMLVLTKISHDDR